METLRRQIHPEIRVVDREHGIVDYVASDETLDAYHEVIRAKGWRFNHFKKNAPFVDSHKYDTLSNLVGKVIDFRVDARKGQLVNRVQWAVDVPENQLAQLGWKMTESGYLKAVSVGFFPTKTLTASSAKRGEWLQELRELGLTEENAPRAIYAEQEQIELSAVIVGANPNALLAAHKAGALSDRDVEFFQKRSGSQLFQIPFDTKSQPSPTNMKQKILDTLGKITGSPKHSLDDLPPTPRDESDQVHGLARALRGTPPSLHRDCQLIVADAQKARWLRAMAQVFIRAPVSCPPEDLAAIKRALTSGDSGLGQALSVFEPLSEDIYALLLRYGAFRSFGVVPMDAGKKKLASVTGKADAAWLTPANQGTTIPADASITGTSISPEVATVGSLVEVSGEALQDGQTTFEGALLEAMVEGLGYRLDFTCLQADGTDDQVDGGMTGIFAHPDVPVLTAAGGNTFVAALDPDDFADCIGKVVPSALARPCRWWISPAFLPSLLKVKDNGLPLLKPPTGPADEWRIHGFPITWAAAAPNTDGAAAKVAVFGRGDAYAVALRQDFEIRSSAVSAKWAQNIYLFRAIARARCIMRDATSFSILKTAAA